MKKTAKASDKFQIQSLSKGLSVLECFKDTDEFGITEIGDIVSLPESSVHRIVTTLEAKGYLYQNSANKKYRLTPKILLSIAKSGNLAKWKEQAKKHMLRLNEQWDENVNLAVRQDNLCSYIELVESKQLLRPNFNIGDYYPLYCTSLGRSLMSDLPETEIDLLLAEELETRTPVTLTDRKIIMDKIKQIEKNKYAIDDEEFYLGLYCISSPIYGVGNKVIAAVGVTAPKVRMDESKVQQLIPAILNTAQAISDDYKSLFTSAN